jgi:hypothetical protein
MPFMKVCFQQRRTEAYGIPIYLDKKRFNTAHRKDYIVSDFIPKIEASEKETGIDLRVSPYIRTLNAMSILNEITCSLGFAIIDFANILFSSFRSF